MKDKDQMLLPSLIVGETYLLICNNDPDIVVGVITELDEEFGHRLVLDHVLLGKLNESTLTISFRSPYFDNTRGPLLIDIGISGANIDSAIQLTNEQLENMWNSVLLRTPVSSDLLLVAA